MSRSLKQSKEPARKRMRKGVLIQESGKGNRLREGPEAETDKIPSRIRKMAVEVAAR